MLPLSEYLSFVFLLLHCALSCGGLVSFVPLLPTRGKLVWVDGRFCLRFLFFFSLEFFQK
jgi:hypothetical protein